MSEIILSLFKEHKVLIIEDLKEKLNIESAKDFVELIKHVEKLEQKSTIVQLPNEKFLYVKEQLELLPLYFFLHSVYHSLRLS